MGPYMVHHIKNNRATLTASNGVKLKEKYSLSLLKPFNEPLEDTLSNVEDTEVNEPQECSADEVPNVDEALDADTSVSKTWIRNEYYILSHEDKKLIECCDGWLNDNIMDAAQKLICKKLGNMEMYQSVLNLQKNEKLFFAVQNEHLQLLHNGYNHWLLSACRGRRVQVCDSLYSTINSETVRCLKSL